MPGKAEALISKTVLDHQVEIEAALAIEKEILAANAEFAPQDPAGLLLAPVARTYNPAYRQGTPAWTQAEADVVTQARRLRQEGSCETLATGKERAANVIREGLNSMPREI